MAYPEINDTAQLSAVIAEILVSGSLYVEFNYTGAGGHLQVAALRSPSTRYGALPQITKCCDKTPCQKETNWKPDKDKLEFEKFIQSITYTCRNCGYGKQIYWIVWQESEPNSFIKVGQYPPLTIEPSPAIAKALGNADTALYKKGLIDFNFGHGIGAVAYMRRIVENKINEILDLIVEAEKLAGHDDAAKEVEEIKKDRNVSKRIDLAAKLLPDHLRPGGHNPLDKLYAPLSAGHHGETDAECLTTFADAQFAFEYLFTQLRQGNEEASKFRKWISDPKK